MSQDGARAGGTTEIRLRAAWPDETLAAGEAVGRAARRVAEEGLVVALRGELGSGKTVFVRGLARGLGVPATTFVVSPTFTIARRYETAGATLHHVDAYRLRDAEELEQAGFEEMWGRGRVTCVEWAERVAEALPGEVLEVWLAIEEPPSGEGAAASPSRSYESAPEAPRTLRLRARGGAAERVLAALAGRDAEDSS